MGNNKNKLNNNKKFPSIGMAIVYLISFTMLGGLATAILYVLAEIPDRLFSIDVVPRVIAFTIFGGLIYWGWYWIKNKMLNDDWK